MKKIISRMLVASILLTTLILPSMAATTFTDVKTSDWYYNDVQKAVELGLVNGVTATTYAPYNGLTVAEAVKLAATMHEYAANGEVTLTNGNPWYQSYVNYAKENGIIVYDFSDYTAKITRAEYMDLFSRALPASDLQAINTVDEGTIPDVGSTNPYYESIYMLYRAGIVQGSDAARSAKPDSNILRNEVAAILTRMMDDSARVKFSLTTEEEQVLTITKQPANEIAKDGEQVAFEVIVTGGTAPYTYDWEVDFSGWHSFKHDADRVSTADIAGNTTNQLDVRVTSATTDLSYRCIITDADGNKVTSNSALLTSESAPVAELKISKQPTSVTAMNGEQVAFEVAVSGGKAPYTYDWEVDFSGWHSFKHDADRVPTSDIAGNTTNKLDVRVTSGTVSLDYRCVITDADGNKVTSNSATLTEEKAPVAELKITSQPKDQTAEYDSGQQLNFSVRATGGTAPYTYKWEVAESGSSTYYEVTSGSAPHGNGKHNQTVGDNTQDLTASADDWNDGAKYRCVITDANGNSVTSNTATAILQKPVAVTIHPKDQNSEYDSGKAVGFSVKAEGGTAPYTYKWEVAAYGYSTYFEVTSGPAPHGNGKHSQTVGENTPYLTVSADDWNDGAKYRCVITDADGNKVTSNSAKLTLQ